jgi:hypothetical protein
MSIPTPASRDPRDVEARPEGTPAHGAPDRPSPPAGPGGGTPMMSTAWSDATAYWPDPQSTHNGLAASAGNQTDPAGDQAAAHRTGEEPAAQTANTAAQSASDAEHPTTFVPEPSPPRRQRSVAAVGTAAIIALLGLPLGWAWSSFAPWLPGVVRSDGLYLLEPYGEQRAGQETWFILLSIGTGIVIGIVAWVALRRFRGPLMVIALAVGGIAGGWIAWRFGHNIGRGHALAVAEHARIGDVILVPPDLRIKQGGNIAFWHGLPYLSGVLLYLAIAAIVTYVVIAGFATNPYLFGPKPGSQPPRLPQPDSSGPLSLQSPNEPAGSAGSDA